MLWGFLKCLLMLVGVAVCEDGSQGREMHAAHFKKLTPVLIVERIEPCLELWEKRLGFARTAEVPEGEGGQLGFVILARDGIEVMYQTRSSLAGDLAPVAAGLGSGRQFLYIEVADLAAIEARLAGVPHVVPRRDTFYGMREVIIRDAAGHSITFARPLPNPGAPAP